MRFVSAIGLVIASSCSANEAGEPAPYHSVDQQYVDKALKIYSGHSADPKRAMRDVYPVVVHLPDRVCVGLNLRIGIAGGDTTICFDKNYNVVTHYVHGE